MMFLYRSRAYEMWAPVLGRILFAIPFLVGASFKIPGTAMFMAEVGQSAAAGIPFATLAVVLAFILEVVTGVALLVGWQTRAVGFILSLYMLLLGLIFYHNWSDLMQFGMFVSHLAFIAGLLYVSVYGAQHLAVRKDPL